MRKDNRDQVNSLDVLLSDYTQARTKWDVWWQLYRRAGVTVQHVEERPYS